LHNLDVIKSADYIIDLGPGGGEDGGAVIAEGTPEEVSINPPSYTGRFLKKKLSKMSHAIVA
jgi:excinuclease ABC subunit A